MDYDHSPQTSSRLLSHISVTIFMFIFAFCTIVGNVFVLFWRRQRRLQENKVQSILLGNLAVSDLLMGIYLIIIAVADITIGDDINPNNIEVLEFSYTCIIAGVSAMLSSEASVFFITLISIDRYICIRFPYTTRKATKEIDNNYRVHRFGLCVWFGQRSHMSTSLWCSILTSVLDFQLVDINSMLRLMFLM